MLGKVGAEVNILVIGELSSLATHLKFLDSALLPINAAIKLSADPESAGLLERGEYLIGIGFVAAQRYIQTVYLAEGLERDVALKLGENVTDCGTHVHAIWQGANYWKHEDEWYHDVSRGRDLKRNAEATRDKLELYTDCDDYTCANLLSVILKGEELSLYALVPVLEAWTTAVSAYKQAP
ncbi:hypothetical protein [uncultured Brevundimonas sp.]|uniref:hypothetical protein n=1 Tax=uncultured Brevundimonas sp. TaxID=213418 RepID=UPI0026180B0E|nr:hypothetical protein [uncultured Brevundimonas sp.]